MVRPRIVVALAAAVALPALGLGGAAWWASTRVPDFYEEALAAPVDRETQREEAKVFVQRTLQLVDDIQHADAWSEEFAQRQINSWLAEDLQDEYGDVVPEGVSEPRVVLRDGRLHFGFRFATSGWDGVVGVVLRPWLDGPNRLAIEIESVQAGLMPIPPATLFEQASQRFEKLGWRAEWRHIDGHDVLLLDLNPHGTRLPVLERLEVVEGAIRVSGRRGDAETVPVFRIGDDDAL